MLAADMARIARTHDYSASVPATSDIETEQLAGSFNVMMGEIRKASVALSNREAELIFRLSRATEKRDNETGGHILRMAALCRLVAEGLNLGRERGRSPPSRSAAARCRKDRGARCDHVQAGQARRR